MKFSQWEKLLELEKFEGSQLERDLRMKCVIAEKDYDIMIKLDYNDMISQLSGVKLELPQNEPKYKVREFQLVKSIDEINFYQFCDAESYLQKNKIGSFFVVFTFTKNDYIPSEFLINEFHKRLEAVEDLDWSEWYPYIQEIIKKKILSQTSSDQFLRITPNQLTAMQKDFIGLITNALSSYRQLLDSQKQSLSLTTYYSRTLLVRLFIWLLKRTSPTLSIKLLYEAVKNIRINYEHSNNLQPV